MKHFLAFSKSLSSGVMQFQLGASFAPSRTAPLDLRTVYLTTLCDMELSHKESKRIERFLKEAKLPQGKTLNAYDFTVLSTITGALR